MSNGYSAASAAGSIFPIVGMGIGLGVIAHTARGVTETMYGRQQPRRGRGRSMTYRPRRSISRTPKLSIRQSRTPRLSIRTGRRSSYRLKPYRW